MFQLRGGVRDRGVPVSRDQFVAGKNFGLKQTLFRLQVIEIQAAVVAHPTRIHSVVLARGLAINDIFARPDQRVATGGAARAKTFRFLQEPDAHLETEIGGGQCADRTDVDCVERIIIFEPLPRMSGENAVAAAIDKAEHVVPRDLQADANAARTKNATLVVERYPRTQLDVLRFLHLVLEKPRIGPTVFDAEFLEPAFARLIAY